MSVFLLCKEIEGTIELRGVFDNRSDAEAHAISDKWLVVPIEKNKLYNENLVSESITGAFWRLGKTEDINASIQALVSRLDNLIYQISDYQTVTDARLEALENF